MPEFAAVHRQGVRDTAARFPVRQGGAGTDGLVADEAHEELEPMGAVLLDFNQGGNIRISSLQREDASIFISKPRVIYIHL